MKIQIDPVSRIEGHLSVSLEVSNGEVSAAHCAGTMFRGFEILLKGRDPLDAVQITQRICGVCPVSHGVASSMALEGALGIQAPDNGRLLRNLILGANYIQSHIIHFYQLSALDFVDITSILSYSGNEAKLIAVRDWVKGEVASKPVNPAAPFLPRYSGDYITDPELNIAAVNHYLQALKMRALAHEMVSVFGGKIPHVPALVPGGVTSSPDIDKIEAYRSRLLELQAFIEKAYLPDVFAIAGAYPQYFKIGRGPGNLLSYGNFPEDAGGEKKFLAGGIYSQGNVSPVDSSMFREDTGFAWFSSKSGLHPSMGETQPAPTKADAYSWVKAPRYDDLVMEVGPLARVLITHKAGSNPRLSTLLQKVLRDSNLAEDDLFSVMGRHLTRALECSLIAEQLNTWLDQLQPGQPAVCAPYTIPSSGKGMGLMEAPRGALGHWIEIGDKVIQRYECIVPTTWNCSPRDDQNRPGALEQALVGVKLAQPDQPIEALRVVHSYDPCLACAVH
jgi:Ni,Fe-hydrogenase I large subunit